MNINNKSGASCFLYFIANKRQFLTTLIFLVSFACTFATPPDVPLKAGMVIRSSVTIKPGIYKLPAADSKGEIITIEGDDITVDFKDAVLQGYLKTVTPDQYIGIGIRVKGNNITIKNAVIKGYKVALLASDCENIRITDCDFSYNYKQHLRSTLAHENVSDRMSYHTNEKDEWLRYGAGIYLKNCSKAQVDNCTITGGQNGLMLTGCGDGLFWNNNFSFLSGIGIGMYRSSRNKVMHNKLDWCVRGYSHEVYGRDQDSAGILVYEQSSENTFAYNSATHSGDGFFLWAGQHTMDTGEEGCNDNLLYGNDFSYAPNNGIEMTFSSNRVINNRIEECTYGIWGGYSYNSLIAGNQLSNNTYGIAIEHGQGNSIIFNSFNNDTTGIWLWSRKSQPKDWAYAQKCDTCSQNHIIGNNTFKNSPVPMLLTATNDILVENNNFHQFKTLAKTDSSVTNIEFIENNLDGYEPALLQSLPVAGKLSNSRNYLSMPIKKWNCASAPFTDSTGMDILLTILQEDAPDSLEGAINTLLPAEHPRGRKYILVDEWGPYDFKSPVLWLRAGGTQATCEFELLGPAGKWKIKKLKGITLSATSGNVPGRITAKLSGESLMDVEIELEYTGVALLTPFGEKIPAGKPYIFHYRHSSLPINWSVK